jgi:hypothetical protein
VEKFASPKKIEVLNDLPPNKDLGMKSFVDILTIDYRKTLNDYKNKLMQGVRDKAVSTQLASRQNR